MDATRALAIIGEIISHREYDERQFGTKLNMILKIVKECNPPQRVACNQHAVEYCRLCHT